MSSLNQVVIAFFSMIGGDKCKTERIGITMTEEKWNQSLSDKESTYFKNLESKILMAVSLSRLRSQCLMLLLQRPVCSVCASVTTKNPRNRGRSRLISPACYLLRDPLGFKAVKSNCH